MKRVALVIIAFVLSLSPQVIARSVINPSYPTSSSHVAGNGITWTMRMPRALTNHDAVMLVSQMKNSSDKQFTFHTDVKTNIVKIILTRKDKPAIVKTINISLPPQGTLQLQSGNYKPKPKEVVWSFRVDLRTLFGRFEQGQYSVQVVYPQSSYVIKDFKAYQRMALKSPVVKFTISKTSVQEATKLSKPPADGVRFELFKAVKANGHATRHAAGKLTNNTDAPISFAGYMNFGQSKKPAFKPPLSTTMGFAKWHPKYSWVSQGLGFCGTGLGTYVLGPGKSVIVMLNHPYSGDGIYRYELRYTTAKGKKRATAVTKPVLIASFKPQPS